jgi:hypothetical protein
MTLRAYQETLDELYPPPQPDEDEDDRLDRIEQMQGNLSRRMNSIEAMQRMRKDEKAGLLPKPTTEPVAVPKQPPAPAVRGIQELTP